MKSRAVVSWSGGKDCCLALHRVKNQFEIVGLITMMTEDGRRSRSHGLRPELLYRQAQLLRIPLFTEEAAWADYDAAFGRLLFQMRTESVTHVVFGDIYPEANRIWAESMCASQGLTAVEPLWAEPTDRLADEFLSTGAIAVITTVRDAYLDAGYLGQPLTRDLVKTFVQKGIDPCGERGEFHTFVTRYEGFTGSIPVSAGAVHRAGGCSAIDLDLTEPEAIEWPWRQP